MKKKLFKYKRFWLLLAVALYLLAGFFYLPGLLAQQLRKQAAERIGMQLDFDQLSVNPLSFTTDLSGISLTDQQQQTWFKAQRLTVNFDPLTLLWGHWQISELSLKHPELVIRTAPSGQLITPHWSPPEGTAKSSQPLDFAIADINISGGILDLQAGHIREDFALNINQLAFSQDALTSTDQEAAFTLTIGTNLGETGRLTGQYNHQSGNIRGDLELTDWQSSTLLSLLPEGLHLSSEAGSLSARGQIDWHFSQRPQLDFELISWQDWQLSQTGLFTADQFSSKWHQVQIDTERSVLTIEQIESAQGHWQVYRSPTPNQSFQHIEPTTDALDSTWQLTVSRIEISNWQWQWHDTSLKATLSGRLQQLHLLGLNNLGQAITASSQWQMSAGGTFSTADQLTQDPLHIDSKLTINQLNLAAFRPWINEATDLLLTNGQLNAEQHFTSDLSSFRLTGQFDISQFKLANPDGSNFAQWQMLQAEASSIDSLSKTIVLDQITLDEASGKLLNNADQSLNKGHSDQGTGAAETQPWTLEVGEIKTTTAELQPPD